MRKKNFKGRCEKRVIDKCADVCRTYDAVQYAYSGLCCGYSLSREGGVYSLRGLMLNIIADKVAWCQKFGISVQKEDWDCDRIKLKSLYPVITKLTYVPLEVFCIVGQKSNAQMKRTVSGRRKLILFSNLPESCIGSTGVVYY